MGKGIYYKVDCEECKRLELTGSAINVYFFIKAFRDGLVMGQERMADQLCMSRRTFIRALQVLTDNKLVMVNESEQVFNGGKVYEYRINPDPCVKITHTPVSKRHKGCAKTTQGAVSNLHRGCVNVAQGTPYIYTSNNTSNNTSNIQGEESASEEHEIIIKGITDFYQQLGLTYIPDFRVETTAAMEICGKIKIVMAAEKWVYSIDEFRRFWAEFLRKGYSAADAFQRSHYDLKTINSQFNSLYNIIKNGREKPTNSNAKGQRKFSSDFIAEHMRKAGITIQSDGDK